MPECDLCGTLFTATGLKLHRNTKRCGRLAKDRPVYKKAVKEKQRMIQEGKLATYAYVHNALLRRDCLSIVGHEMAPTKYIDGGGYTESVIVSEHWVYDWVHRLYMKHNMSGSASVFYSKMLKLRIALDEDPEEFEKLKGLYILQSMAEQQ